MLLRAVISLYGCLLSVASFVLFDSECIPRNDGFFDGERSDADEVIEGVLLTAMTTYQEKKIPYIANLLATIACGDVDVETAHLLVQQADSVSWLELKVLTIFYRVEEFPMPSIAPGDHPRTWPHYATRTAFNGINSPEGKGYIFYESRILEGELGLKLPHVKFDAVRLTNLGRLLAQGMDLVNVPTTELRETYEALIAVPVEA